MYHQPVLLSESIAGLAINPNGIYVDGTFGYGGHSRKILERLSEQGRLFAFDKDPAAIAYGSANFAADKRIQFVHASFTKIAEIARHERIYGSISGVLLDLGVSSPQLDDPERGFSFMHPGPLDMRMDSSQSLMANDFINTASIAEMVDVFRQYGEERFSLRIARAIALARSETLINTTQDLAAIVKQANPRWEKHKHPATRVFQALRIYVNQELNELQSFLATAVDILAVKGRLVVISFHSLEDRIVKQFMRSKARATYIPTYIPIQPLNTASFKLVGKAIKPSSVEISNNFRARSAILRIGEKIA